MITSPFNNSEQKLSQQLIEVYTHLRLSPTKIISSSTFLFDKELNTNLIAIDVIPKSFVLSGDVTNNKLLLTCKNLSITTPGNFQISPHTENNPFLVTKVFDNCLINKEHFSE